MVGIVSDIGGRCLEGIRQMVRQHIVHVQGSRGRRVESRDRVSHVLNSSREKKMTTAGLEPATFWCHLAIEAKRATIAPGSHPYTSWVCHYIMYQVFFEIGNSSLTRSSAYLWCVSSPLMQHHQDWSIQVLRNPVFAQIAPLIVVFIVPVVILLAFPHLRQPNFDRLIDILSQILAMVMDGLGFSLPWPWTGPQRVSSSSSSRSRSHRRKSSSGKVAKTRPEQIALQKVSKDSGHGPQFLAFGF